MTYKSGMSHDDDEEEQKEDELNLLDQVGFGMGALAASLGGLFDVGPEDVQTESNSESNKNDNNSKNARTNVGATESDNLNEIPLYDGESTAISTTNRTSGHSTGNTSGQSGQSSDNDWLGYLGNMIFPKGSASIPSGAESTIFSGDTTTYDQESTFQEDEDSYLLQQALAAARAIHHVQGVEYDETQEINVLSDIKFVVVTVLLPLGCKCSFCVCIIGFIYCIKLNKLYFDLLLYYYHQYSSKNMKLVFGYQKSSLMAMQRIRVFSMVINLLPSMVIAQFMLRLMKWQLQYQALRII